MEDVDAGEGSAVGGEGGASYGAGRVRGKFFVSGDEECEMHVLVCNLPLDSSAGYGIYGGICCRNKIHMSCFERHSVDSNLIFWLRRRACKIS